MNPFRQSRFSSNVAMGPLVGMIIALVAATLPLMEKVASWVMLGFIVACIVRIVLNRPGARLPSLPLKLLLFAGSVGGVAFNYGSPLGLEPGFSILIALVALKLVEANGPRDFHVLALLGFFLALCDLFFSQDLIQWIYVAAILLLLLSTLVRFHRGTSKGSYPRSTWLALRLLLQALPIAVLLFLFFPRIYGGFRFQFGQSLMNIGGMSDRLSPGSISSIALNNDVVFRADFPDGNIPPMSSMYWRGGILWRGDGLTWVLGPFFSRNEYHAVPMGGLPIRQRISLQPHGGRWLFALDRPIESAEIRGATYLPGGILQSKRAIISRYRYEVISRPDDRETTLPRDQMTAALQLPSHIDPRVKALVDSWKAEGPKPAQIVETAIRFFRREHFVYTLQPGPYNDRNGLEEFLFERRQGFCEHYAAAFATLMRIAGVPTRVIIGYHAGEYNSMGQYVIVRQSDAHAWCEVWLQGVGWQRVDPTDVIAPDRISTNLESYLASHTPQTDATSGGRSLAATGWREIQHDFQLAWDSLNYQWDLHILNFDEEAQTNFLMSLGLGALSWTSILFWILVITALFVGGLSFFLRRSHTPVDKVAKGYAGFCRALARGGLSREPWEGAQHFATRASKQFPEHAELIARISQLYIELRYGRDGANAGPFLAAVRRLPRFNATSGT